MVILILKCVVVVAALCANIFCKFKNIFVAAAAEDQAPAEHGGAAADQLVHHPDGEPAAAVRGPGRARAQPRVTGGAGTRVLGAVRAAVAAARPRPAPAPRAADGAHLPRQDDALHLHTPCPGAAVPQQGATLPCPGAEFPCPDEEFSCPYSKFPDSCAEFSSEAAEFPCEGGDAPWQGGYAPCSGAGVPAPGPEHPGQLLRQVPAHPARQQRGRGRGRGAGGGQEHIE